MGMGLCGTGEQETVAESMVPMSPEDTRTFLRRQMCQGSEEQEASSTLYGHDRATAPLGLWLLRETLRAPQFPSTKAHFL